MMLDVVTSQQQQQQRQCRRIHEQVVVLDEDAINSSSTGQGDVEGQLVSPTPNVVTTVEAEFRASPSPASLAFQVDQDEKQQSAFSPDHRVPIVDHAHVEASSVMGSLLFMSVKKCLKNDLLFEQRRIEQQGELMQVYRRWCSHDKCAPEFVLMKGPSGSGKTHLVASTLTNVVSNEGGMLIQGKFDMLQRAEPYQAFVSAFTEFANKILSRIDDDAAAVTTTKSAILEAVGKGASFLTGMIPALEPLLGQHQEYSNSSAVSKGGISCFAYIFRRFVKSICSTEHPIVFLLQNLQWADPCSLELLVSLLTDRECQGALFIGTCCDANTESPLSLTLQTLERESVPVTEILVNNLSKKEIAGLTQRVLQLTDEQCSTLVDLMYVQTEGNLFYVKEFLRWLEEEKLLSFDPILERWQWKLEEITLTIRGSCVGDFLVDKVEQLPLNVQQVLKIASCLGSMLDPKLLQLTMESDVTSCLNAAVDHGVLIVIDRPPQTFCFAQDLVRKAAYALVSTESRHAFHLMIARRLWEGLNKRGLDERDLDKHLYTLASQFLLSGQLIQDEEEKAVVAALCLRAGRKSAASSTFQIASAYLKFGIELLGPTCWRNHYALALDLYNAEAEMALCTANFARMDELLHAIFSNVRDPQDRLQAHATRIYSFAIRDQQQKAIELGKEVVKELGESFPHRLLQIPLTLHDLAKVRLLLRRKSDSMLLRMPAMEDPTKVSVIRFLDVVLLSAMVWRPAFAFPVVLKMMKLTLRYGSSPWTANAFAAYGMLCSRMGSFEEGCRFGQLALKVLETSGRREFLPRVYAMVYGCVYSWKRPIIETLEPLQQAHRVGLETGDVEFGFVNANLLFINSFESGAPLTHIESGLKRCCAMMETRKQQQLIRRFCMVGLQTTHHLMGYTEDPLSWESGDVVDLSTALDDLTEANNPMVKAGVARRRTFLAYVFEDYDLAVELSKEWRRRIFRFPHSAMVLSACFLEGLIAAMAARRHPNERKKCLRVVDRQIRRFKKLAYESPQNCLDKLSLLKAERASVIGHHKIAVTNYTSANALAADSGCLWSQAIANERAAEHHSTHGDFASARICFDRAYDIWHRWGAYAKAQQLKNKDCLQV